jgi:peroxiredoxin
MRKSVITLSALALVAGMCVWTTRVSAESPAASTAKVGHAAPTFSLQDQDGKAVDLASLKGKVVVLEWFNNECPYVVKHYAQQHMNKLADKWEAKEVVWLAINSTAGKTNATNKAIAEEWKIDRPILNDSSGAVGHSYEAKTTPHMFVIDPEGKLVYAGAIDSDRSSDPNKVDGATNYVSKALEELLAGTAISEPQTKPYGCSVKYAK